MPHPDLAVEQEYLDHAYICLEEMRARTARAVSITDSAAQAVDSAIAQWHLGRRLATLDADVPGLSFGRLDHESGTTWYVGRRHVEDERGDPVVVDWRADVSTPFYRATPADPQELSRRRRFLMTGRTIDDLFDEVFDDPDSVDAAHHGGIPDPLLVELERSRTGEMRDIVATIAAEQDRVIRAPLDTCLVVQGGPGTGKTAVGLHRAAFLLYEHRGSLDNDGVLVLGPNPIFLRYVSQVLPSLGEAAVRQTTLARLLAGTAYRVRAADSDAVNRLKGDARMAGVIATSVASTIRMPATDLDVATRWGTVRLPAAEVAASIAEVRARGVPHNVGRSALRTRLLRQVRRELANRRGEEVAGQDDLDADLRAADRLWPTLSAPAVVRKLLSGRAALRAAASDVLDGSEQAALLRSGTRRIDQEPWTEADLVLLDEAEARVAGAPRSYGHVVVDEAQDFSAMAFRAVARRCPSTSMTILGDLAQATGPAAQHSWADVITHLGAPANASIAELDLGYRVPAVIIDVANRLLAEAAPDVTPCRSVRLDGRPPTFVAVDAGGLAAEAGRQAVGLASVWGTVGVIVPDELRAGLPPLPPAVMAVSPSEAKGLEFDAVVVVEPALVARGTQRGLRLLYVALTRAVQELVVVHAQDLPAALTSA